ncbi:MAG: tRNA (adenosine(37)-N6)-threonylcarbamoyltransferase complex dimerization subunit type 1 TsaB [Flavobacteriaceae bacterium]|nr:tRNA (adenosine(37)-N6)-threonylcarbamoyltransferase complex dimerization subunit type 1 TsaB [Flavobacteriaceae bacterium]
MSLILNLETSSKNCSVSLSSKGELVSNFDVEDDKFRHSELLTSSIQDILTENNFYVKDLDAISIGVGPGSFTGLRIGFSVAKGLCYPHKIKFIGIPTLKILANSVELKSENIISLINDKGDYFYLAKYNTDLEVIISPRIELIDENYLNNIIDENSTIVVNTDSAYKLIEKLIIKKASLIKNKISSLNMVNLSQKSFDNNIFEDIAYTEPMYVKKPYVN